jgi:hypothetical protein
MDITLLIGTCDEYSMLWNNFVTLTNRYWQIDSKKLFVSETKTASYEGYDCITPGTDYWSNRMIAALNKIDTEYTFFVLEDYYFTEKITNDELLLHIDFMEVVKANKLMVHQNDFTHLTVLGPRQYKDRAVYKLFSGSNYLTSVQPSIWKTKHLLKCMKKDWSPWEFEIKGSELIRNHEDDTYLMVRDKKIYWNAVRKGLRLCDGWDELKQKEGLQELNLSKRD